MKLTVIFGFCAVSVMAQDPAPEPVPCPEISAWYRLTPIGTPVYRWVCVDLPSTLVVDTAGRAHLSVIPPFVNDAPILSRGWVEFSDMRWEASVNVDPTQPNDPGYILQMPPVAPQLGQVMTFTPSPLTPTLWIGSWITPIARVPPPPPPPTPAAIKPGRLKRLFKRRSGT